MDIKRLLAGHHRDQRGCIGAVEQDIIAPRTRRSQRQLPRLSQGVAQAGIGRRAAAPGPPRSAFAQFDVLKRARLGDGVAIRAKIDHRALPAEDRIRPQRRHRRTGDPAAAADLNRLVVGIDCRRHIQRRAKRAFVSIAIVAFLHRADIDQAQIGHRHHQPGGDPFAPGIDGGHPGRNGNHRPGSHNLAALNQHGPIGNRFAAIADHQPGMSDRHVLSLRRQGDKRAERSGGEAEPLHFTSPSPG